MQVPELEAEVLLEDGQTALRVVDERAERVRLAFCRREEELPFDSVGWSPAIRASEEMREERRTQVATSVFMRSEGIDPSKQGEESEEGMSSCISLYYWELDCQLERVAQVV